MSIMIATMYLANYIKSDLAGRLQSGDQLPVRDITLKALATHYNVSFTPVRAAISELIDEGLLEKGPNRRLRRGNSIPEASAPQKSARPEPPRDLYQIMVNDLAALCVTGEDVSLREESLAAKYEVSRTVIRNILHRLAGEGIVDHLPRRGWRLKAFQEHDLKAFTEVRVLLELKALDLARPKIQAEDLERMLAANAPPPSPDDPPRSDESLHEYFTSLAGNPYISDFLDRRTSRYFRLLLKWEESRSDEIIRKVAGEHREILNALLENRWRAARKALSDHIVGNNRFLFELHEIERKESGDFNGNRRLEASLAHSP